MKKTLKLISAAALMACATTVAQAQVSLIPRFGLNFSNFGGTGSKYGRLSASDGTLSATLKTVTGFSFGLGFEIPFNDILAIQPEVNFTQFGGYSEVSDLGGAKTSNQVISNNIQVPVFLKAKFGSDAVKFSVFAGPYAAVCLSGTIKTEGPSAANPAIKITESNDLNFRKSGSEDPSNDDYRRIDLGAQGGIGVSFNIGIGMLGLDARYNLGLANLTQTDPFNVAGNSRDQTKDYVYNRSIMFGVTYAIPLGGK